jgi:hypothetical protein
MFQKLLSTSGVRVKTQLIQTAVLKERVPNPSPKQRYTARAQNTVFQSSYKTMDKVHKPSNPKLRHHPENSSELTTKR